MLDVIATAGDKCVSGKKFDIRLAGYYAGVFQTAHGKNLRANQRAMVRLGTACEHAKRALSSSMETFIELDALYDGIDFYSTITRARLESVCADLFEKLIRLVEKLLEDAKLTKDQVDEIVFIGGSTRIPKVQQMLKDFFNGKPLSRPLRPDEAATFGVAVQGGVLGGQLSPALEQYILLDTGSLVFGVEIDNSAMEVMIPRDSTLPVRTSRTSRTFSTSHDNQSTMRIKVIEGKGNDKRLLHELQMDGILPMPRRLSEIVVTFHVDGNGSLTVSAVEKLIGKQKEVKIDSGRLSASEVGHMRKEIEDMFLDPEEESRVQAKSALEQYAISLRTSAVKHIAELKRSIETEEDIDQSAVDTLHTRIHRPRAFGGQETEARRSGHAFHSGKLWKGCLGQPSSLY